MAGQAKVLSCEDIDSVFQVLKTSRDRALFGLGIYTGLRISEILALRQEQVFTADGGIKNNLTVKRLKKRDKVAYTDIPVHPKLVQLLKEYRRKVGAHHWLFPSRNSLSGHISRFYAHRILHRAFASVKIDGASTNSMRRSCLTFLSRAGVPLRTIQSISGHSNLGQLQSYLQVDPDELNHAISSLKY